MTNLQWMERHLRDLAQVDKRIAEYKERADIKVRTEARKQEKVTKQRTPDSVIQVALGAELDNPEYGDLVSARNLHERRVQMFALAHIATTLPELRLQVDARTKVSA